MDYKALGKHLALTVIQYLPALIYALAFVFIYYLVSLYIPKATMSGLIGACQQSFSSSLTLLLTSPVNYYEILLVGNIKLGLDFNFLLPVMIILITGIYLARYAKPVKKLFSIHSVFWLSVGATYLLSLIYWGFGKSLGAHYNCPSIGTSIIGVSLSAFMLVSLLIDLFTGDKKAIYRRYALYIVPIGVFLFLVLLYFANGIIHLYGLSIFTSLLIIYLLAKGKIKYKDIAKRVSLRRAWILFLVALIVYIVYNTTFYNQIVFQITTTLMTIFIISLTMYTSNKELHKASEQQTATFKGSIEKLTISVDRFYDFLENQRAAKERTEAQARAQAKPDIYIQPSIKRGWLLTDCLLNIENKGGYATEIKLAIGKQDKGLAVGDLGRNMQLPVINCGRTLEFGDIEEVQVKLYLKDGLMRRYFSNLNINFKGEKLIHISLTEIT